MSNFVYPAYFETFRQPDSVQFDHMKQVTKPFQILKGGYQMIFKGGKFSQVYGSKTKEKRFAKEDRRGHRSETRRARKLVKANLSQIERHFS